MRHPSCDEIANDYEKWCEYVDTNEEVSLSDFESEDKEIYLGTFESRLKMIHDLWPNDCNCDDSIT